MAGDSSTAALRVRSRRLKGHRRTPRKIKGAVESISSLPIDSISSLPDAILQHVLSFIPTILAIKTSLLSKRWRHVLCNMPSLSFDDDGPGAINETLTLYTAPKIMSFHLRIRNIFIGNVPDIDRWIKFSMSRNVENLSLAFLGLSSAAYKIHDFLYNNSSVQQLSVELYFSDMMVPRCSVSWTSLKKLSLCRCNLSDEYMTKILSGCPILESLSLRFCVAPDVLDLSKSMRLRTLEIVGYNRGYNIHWVWGPTQIVAPYIHCLILTSCQSSPCTLVDVSSLAEAKLNICISPFENTIEAYLLQDMVLKMLEKLHDAEKLTFEEIFLQILSLAELRGVPFPMFKVKALTLKTSISQYVIHGIERILQNSPDLKTLTVHTRNDETLPSVYFDEYVASQGLNPDQCWRSKDGTYWNRSRMDIEPTHVVSFMELMLKTTKTLEKMVVQLEESYRKYKKVVSKTLSHNNNVSIVLSTIRSMPMSHDIRYEW